MKGRLPGEEVIKKGKCSKDRVDRVAREYYQSAVAEVAKKHGVSEQTIRTWRKKCGMLEEVDVRHV